MWPFINCFFLFRCRCKQCAIQVASDIRTYSITVTDNAGCYATIATTITQPALPLTISMATHNDVLCNGVTGSATANSATGGTSPYTYNWTPSGGTNLSAHNLSAGTYIITATDGNNCTATATVTITQPAPLNTIVKDTAFSDTACTGIVYFAGNGGTPPYKYLWTPGGQIQSFIAGLCDGIYCCKVTDNNGCIDSACVNVVTGVNNIVSNITLVIVYPNPNNGQFTIQLPVVNTHSSVEIYNVLGEKVYSHCQITNSPHYQIDLSNQPNGVYFYRVLSGVGDLVGEGKVVVQK